MRIDQASIAVAVVLILLTMAATLHSNVKFYTEIAFCYVVDQISTNFLNQNTDYFKQEAFYVPNSLSLEKEHTIRLSVFVM
jgi:hypothetical protein